MDKLRERRRGEFDAAHTELRRLIRSGRAIDVAGLSDPRRATLSHVSVSCSRRSNSECGPTFRPPKLPIYPQNYLSKCE
jgi:hypothetical protein